MNTARFVTVAKDPDDATPIGVACPTPGADTFGWLTVAEAVQFAWSVLGAVAAVQSVGSHDPANAFAS